MDKRYPIDLSGDNLDPKGVEQLLYDTYVAERDKIITQVKEGTFNLLPYSFTEKGKGLWKVAGLYVIANKKRKRFVIGSTKNLSNRKTRYWGDMRMNPLPSNLYEPIRDELNSQQIIPSDYYFIPVVVVRKGLEETDINKMVSRVEKRILGEIPADQESVYYNRQNTVWAPKTTNVPKPVRFGEYVWPSLSAATSYFSCSNPFFRKKIDEGVLDWSDPINIDLPGKKPPENGPLKTQLVNDFNLATKKTNSEIISQQTVRLKGKYPLVEMDLSIFDKKNFYEQESLVLRLKLFSRTLESGISSFLRQLWNSQSDPDQYKQDYLTLRVTSIMLQILQEIDTKMLDYSLYPIIGDGSGDFNECRGWYLILNKKTLKFYIGYAKDLLSRRSFHSNMIQTLGTRLNSEIRKDRLNGSHLDDFSFVPCLILQDSALTEAESERYLHNVEVDLINYF